MRYLIVMLRRNELQSQQLEIAPHELPVLAYVHGEENCNVTGVVTVDRDVPDANEELTRLTTRYGRDKANESLESRVSAVYGSGPNGLRQLAAAIAYGQREGLAVDDFRLGSSEPAHTMPTPAQRTRPSTVGHDAPAAMTPGAVDAKREGTVRSRKRAAAASK